mgnify:CR=1 FL=1|jgi:sialidase-1
MSKWLGDGFYMFQEIFDWTSYNDHQTAPIRVRPGDVVRAEVAYVKASNSYTMTMNSTGTKEVSTYEYQLLQAKTEAQAYFVLEHQPDRCDELPPSGVVSWTNIEVDVNYKRVQRPTWTAKEESPKCGAKAVVVSSDTVNITWNAGAARQSNNTKKNKNSNNNNSIIRGVHNDIAPNAGLDLPSTPVFTPGLGNISCFRIPAIVQSGSGVLLAFAEARHGSCGDGDVHEMALRRSLDGGATWMDGVTFPVGNSSFWVGNPSAVALDDGSVVVVYTNHDKTCTGDCGTGNGMVRTTDDGATWSRPIDLSGDFGPLARGALPGPGTALQLSATHPTHPGRLLVVSHKGAYQNDYVTVSDDNGARWSTRPRAYPGMDEAALTELPNGDVLLNMRHRSSPVAGRAVALSTDGGDTFGNVTYDKALVGPVCQASIVSFGGATYFSNPADPRGRDAMTVKKSVDNARTWTRSLLVHAGPSFGYSCLVKGELKHGAAGQGGILFESANEEIAFARFGLDF